MNQQILFVDDEPNILTGLRRNLRAMRGEWDMSFAEGGREALRLVDRTDFDAVVTDMRMPEVNGAQLLREIEKRSPRTIRIVLSGQTDRKAVYSLVGPSHQFLSKPCDAATLIAMLQRAFRLRALLADKNLQTLVAGLRDIPCLPQIYHQLIKAAGSPESSLTDIEAIVSQDMGLTAKVLKLANSGYFGIGWKVNTTAKAITLLGTETICSLVLCHGIAGQLHQNVAARKIFADLWEHSLECAGFARAIARREGLKQESVDQAFTAGLLHDIGRFILHQNLESRYLDILESVPSHGIDLYKAERDALGTTHSDVGAYLLALWGLPDNIIETVAYHHHPQDGPARFLDILPVVHVADSLARIFHNRYPIEVAKEAIVTPFLKEVVGRSRLMAWTTTCAELVQDK